MAIEQITLRNFQCHRNLTVKFSPTVTTLVGPNDSGKSAVLRALRYVALNKPRGKAHVRRKAKLCSVTVTVGGREIKRISGRKNVYSLDGKRFVAFRNAVPYEIDTLLNVSDINFQRQHDGVFWLALSPGQLARELNRLVDLQTIDAVQAWVVRRLRTNTTEQAVTTQRLHDATDVCKRLSLIKKIRNLFDILTNLRKLTPRINAQIRDIREAVESVSKFDLFLRHTAHVASIAHTLHAQAGELLACQSSVNTLRAVTRNCVRCQAASSGNIDLRAVSLLGTLSREIELSSTQTHALRALTRRAKLTQKEITRCEQTAKHEREKIERELNGRCPACGTILSDKTLV